MEVQFEQKTPEFGNSGIRVFGYSPLMAEGVGWRNPDAFPKLCRNADCSGRVTSPRTRTAMPIRAVDP